MPTNKVVATITVDFNAGSGDGILLAEIDSRDDGYNPNGTSFVPGDSPVFLLYHSSNVTVGTITTSAGTAASIGSSTLPVKEMLTFQNAREASPSKPISSDFSSKWLGTNGGTVTIVGNKLMVPTKTVAVLLAEYTTTFTAYRISNVPAKLNGETSFQIMVVVEGSYT